MRRSSISSQSRRGSTTCSGFISLRSTQGLSASRPRGIRCFDQRGECHENRYIEAVGGFTAFKWHYVAENLTSTPLSVKLVPVIGKPIISGLENYAKTRNLSSNSLGGSLPSGLGQ
ncbi:hypothetical protein J5N97_021390 [Dioscorea zingiberensis]|uniref:Uncharacterized protein n=1 Tax=Dioscorea zingiberensis TaxID=325984 RepID=A0A9D5CHI2_9LILI|nr:hypothetical protein J5N97_021390 [Dioscorea zingiberensis]